MPGMVHVNNTENVENVVRCRHSSCASANSMNLVFVAYSSL